MIISDVLFADFKCSRCNYPLILKQKTECPNCGQPLDWSSITYKDTPSYRCCQKLANGLGQWRGVKLLIKLCDSFKRGYISFLYRHLKNLPCTVFGLHHFVQTNQFAYKCARCDQSAICPCCLERWKKAVTAGNTPKISPDSLNKL